MNDMSKKTLRNVVTIVFVVGIALSVTLFIFSRMGQLSLLSSSIERAESWYQEAGEWSQKQFRRRSDIEDHHDWSQLNWITLCRAFSVTNVDYKGGAVMGVDGQIKLNYLYDEVPFYDKILISIMGLDGLEFVDE